MSSSSLVPTLKNKVELNFRTARIGTLRTFPIKTTKGNAIQDEPIVICTRGIKFPLSLKQDNNDVLNLKMSAKHIKSVHAYLGRGCPVIWIKPDKEWSEKIRNLLNMNKRGLCINPESEFIEEQEIGIICATDPLPFNIVHSIKYIFNHMAKEMGKRFDELFVSIPQEENNDKLVNFTVYMEKIQHQRNFSLDLEEFRKYKSSSLNSDSDFSDFDDSSEPLHARADKTQNNHVCNTEKNKEDKRKEATSDQRENNKDKAPPLPPPSVSETPRKVHRARKSIPNPHRVVSIESQLRARVSEQSSKQTSPAKEDAENRLRNPPKRSSSDDSERDSDSSWKPSCETEFDRASSPELPPIKKRKKDASFLNIKKKKKKPETVSRPETPPMDSSDDIILVNGHDIIPPTPTPIPTQRPPPAVEDVSANSSSKLMQHRKVQALTMHMKMLRRDHENMLNMTPLCTCVIKSPHSLNLSGSESPKCMAIDHIDGRLYGCYNDIKQPEMFRPSNKVPVLGLCNEHRERMLRHESCPGCGTFCVGGVFMTCIKNSECPHRFHRDCMILSGRHGDCPHCGGDLGDVKEVNLTPGNDADLMWILAGHVPEKMKLKRYVDERGKSARMGHRAAVQILPEKIPGVVVPLPSGITIDSTTMAPLSDRTQLEAILNSFKSDTTRKNRFQPRVFMQYVGENDVTKVLHMLADGFEPEQHKSVLNAALLEAVPNKDLSIVHLLLQAGADINFRYDNGDTPLFRAMQKKNKHLILHLLINKPDVSILDDDGMTVLHRAAMEGYLEGCHLLMMYGKVNINSRSDGGYTPIMWAAEHKQTNMAKYLLHSGADLSLVDDEGNICLHWAALSGDIDILYKCLERNSNPNHANVHGDTPLHVAARENHHNCISLLLTYGADSTIKNNEQDTALSCAPEQNTSWMMLKVNEWIRKIGLINNKVLPLNRERVLCEDLSRGYDKVPITCVNAVDSAPCPTQTTKGFHYVCENVHTSPDTTINRQITSWQPCSCTDNCSTSTCNCGLISEGCWYADDGTLLPNFDITEPPLIFECNQICKCSTSCRNRVVQKGIKYRLQVHRTVGMGWGVRALETIPRGAFVCDYVGELITDAEADVREDDSYLFDLENKDGEMYCIDARNYGNVSRFINHLCEPNLVPIRVFVDHHDVRFPKLAYFTTREIQAYEELGFDYGDRFWDVKCRQFTCQCGSVNCKYSADVYKKKAAKDAEEKEKADNQVNGSSAATEK